MLKKLFKGVKKVAKKVAPFAGLVAGAFGLNPMAAAGLGALIGGLGGGSKGAIAGGLGGYFSGSAFGKDICRAPAGALQISFERKRPHGLFTNDSSGNWSCLCRWFI